VARSLTPPRLTVVGAGWAGLSAAVAATERGWSVTLLDMARQPGGRARSSADANGRVLDNGQHILIGAYRETLSLMRRVDADPDRLLRRLPLDLRDEHGQGLHLPAGHPVLAFARGILGWRELPWGERLGVLTMAARWRLSGFRCQPDRPVSELATDCPPRAFEALLDPLCVAALNTPAGEASGQVLLTVLRDALFSGPGAADLLLPTVPLDELLPRPAMAWLLARGIDWRPGRRVHAIEPQAAGGWQVDGEPCDRLLLACGPRESARLLAPWAPDWSAQALALDYQPIVTVWLHSPGVKPGRPMVRLSGAPAQFAFDLHALQGMLDTWALVVSGAGQWVTQGQDATAQAALAQWRAAWPDAAGARVMAVRTEKRATFACTPALARPSKAPCPDLEVAGDHIAGPYPATLEGAVRSGQEAVQRLAG
jgi:squalene-associated FAD-dependent desaturase